MGNGKQSIDACRLELAHLVSQVVATLQFDLGEDWSRRDLW